MYFNRVACLGTCSQVQARMLAVKLVTIEANEKDTRTHFCQSNSATIKHFL
jgi:hypothetical protein